MEQRATLSYLLNFALFLGSGDWALANGDIQKDTYDALAKVQELMANGRYEDAGIRLVSIGVGEKTSNYEKALLSQTQGYLHAHKGRYREAITALQKCLALNTLPGSAARDTRYLLIQVLSAATRWEEAAKEMDAWMASEKRPAPQAHALAGAIYTQVKRLNEAADKLRIAIDRSETPKQHWFEQLAAVYIESERYSDAAAHLGDMVRRFPQRTDYWLQLSEVHQALGNHTVAASVLELSHRRGLLDDEAKLLKLANLLVHTGQPYEAGGLLEGALSAGTLASTAENWEILSNAWARAREIPQAMKAIEKALEIEPSVDFHLRRAQLATETEDWHTALDAAEAALSSDKPQQQGEAHLLGGIAYFHLGRTADALDALEEAQSAQFSSVQAKQWAAFLQQGLAVPGDESGNRF